ncbi:SecY-interacting protein Syd [Paraglaciecola aquimarina]|uniref:SecY-interacting protein Syd n=1 Tax=Paraglaciecola aquimarina TaxID=1235557 RepID=A0ABU3T1E0_9ALTE|nr:SecY-interacting protein Syd [Paraglaciecola aquimarina]MDU0356094.1 SecY-interacting protein Syd [Paraglaciecola aquimarina]
MKNDVVEALDKFIQNFILLAQQDSNSLAVEYDPTWPSECYQESGSAGDWVKWCPKLRNDQADFSGFEKAMELTIHPDLKAFYAQVLE